MTPVEIGKVFEEEAKETLEREGYEIKRWFSKEKWTAPCDMLVEKDGEEMYCEVRGVSGEKSSILFPAQKIANLEALAEHKPVILFLIRNGEHKIVRLEDLPKERYVAYPQKKASSNYYRLLERLALKSKTKKIMFKADCTREEIEEIRKVKKKMGARNNAEFLVMLADDHFELKQRRGMYIT